MASTITHTQTRSVVGSKYRVVDTATASVNIPLEPFVFRTVDGVYSRVATATDMAELLNTQVAAQTAGADYYRLATVTQDFDEVGPASDFASGAIARLKQLVVDYDKTVASFIGTNTTTVSS